MPFLPGAIGLFEYLHSVPEEAACEFIDRILVKMSQHYAVHKDKDSSKDLLRRYLKSKVIDNIEAVFSFIKHYLDGQSFKINGESYSLSEWDFLKEPSLEGQFSDLCQTNIHGDLTVENIVVCGPKAKEWYLIDPNPNAVFKVDAMDWAKMFQSLNLGYEFIGRGVSLSLNNNELSFFIPKTSRYEILFDHLKNSLKDKFGDSALKEIYLHEIIHYLRLLPYKMKQDPESGLLFFACTCILIRNYKEAYGSA